MPLSSEFCRALNAGTVEGFHKRSYRLRTVKVVKVAGSPARRGRGWMRSWYMKSFYGANFASL